MCNIKLNSHRSRSGVSVLCLLLFAAIVLIVAGIMICHLTRLMKRLDGGRVPRSTNNIEDMSVPVPTNGGRAFAVALRWEYQWIDFPQGDAKAESAPPAAGPAIGVRAESSNIVLRAYRALEWNRVPASDLLPLDEDGVPINWSRASDVFTGTPVTLQRSFDLVNWTNAAVLWLDGTNEVIFEDGGSGFYRVWR